MKVLVLGGKGTVGQQLVQTLNAIGHEIFVADKDHGESPNYQRCDISEFRQVERTISTFNPDLVYNLAAEFGRWNGEDYYEAVWKTNAIGMKNIIRTQEQMGFKLVHFSSSEVYGDFNGVMSEEVMDNVEIRQLNDYAISKWVNELQIMNSEAMHQTKTVRVRLFNTYGPGEYYSPYRSAICMFAYRALHDIPYTVFLGHRRTSTYVTDCCETLARISNNFKSGEVYNIGGEDLHDMKLASDYVLKASKKSESLVTYQTAEPFTTKEKIVDVSKAKLDLGHQQKVGLEEGIFKTVEWMRNVYSI